MLCGYFGFWHPSVIQAETDGTLDRSFKIGGGASDDIFAVAAMSDGDLVLGGYFTTYDGKERWRLARIHADGTLNEGFDPGDGSGSSPITQLAALPDGKILAAGSFSHFAGFERPLIVRLGADGKVDAKFNAASVFRGIEGRVNALVVLPDGKLLVGGRFDPSAERRGNAGVLLVRLRADGRLDESFTCGVLPAGREDVLSALAVLSDGKLLVGSQVGITRLNADGARDDRFKPPAKFLAPVTALAGQSGGKILLANRQEAGWQVARLEADGQPDPSFHAPSTTGEDAGSVAAIGVQPDGKILLGGSFKTVDGVRRHGLARLEADGTLDKSFEPGTGVEVIPFEETDETPEATVRTLVALAEGKWLAAGRFDLYNGMISHNLARLTSAPPPATNGAPGQ